MTIAKPAYPTNYTTLSRVFPPMANATHGKVNVIQVKIPLKRNLKKKNNNNKETEKKKTVNKLLKSLQILMKKACEGWKGMKTLKK